MTARIVFQCDNAICDKEFGPTEVVVGHTVIMPRSWLKFESQQFCSYRCVGEYAQRSHDIIDAPPREASA